MQLANEADKPFDFMTGNGVAVDDGGKVSTFVSQKRIGYGGEQIFEVVMVRHGFSCLLYV